MNGEMLKRLGIFLGILILVVSIIAVSAGHLFSGGKKSGSGEPRTFEDIMARLDPQRAPIILGEEEAVPAGNLKYIPDGHISKIEVNGKERLFVSAHDKSYIMEGTRLNDIVLYSDSSGNPQAVLAPDGEGLEHDYAGFGSVLYNPKTNKLIGIYHTEQRTDPDASNTQTTAIAVALSEDGGVTWKKQGTIFTGIHPEPAGTGVSGAGQPSAIIVDNYIYLYYVDWNDQMPVGIHLARSPLVANGLPGSWENLTVQGFGGSGISKLLIGPEKSDGPRGYVSSPSISYNTYLHKYLAIFEKNNGFYMATSDDGISWDEPKSFFHFKKDSTLPKENGEIWYSYPSFISDGTESDTKTIQTGYLYYGRGIYGVDHHMVRRSLTLR